MSKSCDFLQGRFEIVGVSDCSLECLRASDHEGVHLIRRDSGEFVIWTDDPCPSADCSCGFWDSDGDPTDVCIAFGKVMPEAAQRLIDDPSLEGE
ncbi:MAG: hypothetical protein ACK42D_01195 [Candidatus Paceibacteria bacterium]